MPTSLVSKPTFESSHKDVVNIVAKRRGSWTLHTYMEWEDVASHLTVRIWKKWHLYDPAKAKSLEHWANRLITNELFNLRRDLLYRHARPCIGGGKSNGRPCVYNQGGDGCGFTHSKKQCAECPLYKAWQESKAVEHNIRASVALENHAQEVSNIQCDFMDIDGIKDKLDKQMRGELTRWEWRIYAWLFIDHLSPILISERLQAIAKVRKRPLGPDELLGYQSILLARKRFAEMMREFLKRAGHIEG